MSDRVVENTQDRGLGFGSIIGVQCAKVLPEESESIELLVMVITGSRTLVNFTCRVDFTFHPTDESGTTNGFTSVTQTSAISHANGIAIFRMVLAKTWDTKPGFLRFYARTFLASEEICDYPPSGTSYPLEILLVDPVFTGDAGSVINPAVYGDRPAITGYMVTLSP
jgi:hypothetical protein